MDEDFRKFVGCAQFVFGVGLLVVTALVGGTFRTEVTWTLEEGGNTVAGDSFDEDLSARHWLWGLVQGQQPNLQNTLDRHRRKGERIGSVSLVTKHTWTDLLVAMVTLGIYAPKTVSVHATVQRARQPAGYEEQGDERRTDPEDEPRPPLQAVSAREPRP